MKRTPKQDDDLRLYVAQGYATEKSPRQIKKGWDATHPDIPVSYAKIRELTEEHRAAYIASRRGDLEAMTDDLIQSLYERAKVSTASILEPTKGGGMRIVDPRKLPPSVAAQLGVVAKMRDGKWEEVSVTHRPADATKAAETLLKHLEGVKSDQATDAMAVELMMKRGDRQGLAEVVAGGKATKIYLKRRLEDAEQEEEDEA